MEGSQTKLTAADRLLTLLRSLAVNGMVDRRQDELAELLGAGRLTTNYAVRALEQRGAIRILRHHADRRAVVYVVLP